MRFASLFLRTTVFLNVTGTIEYVTLLEGSFKMNYFTDINFSDRVCFIARKIIQKYDYRTGLVKNMAQGVADNDGIY